MATFRNESFGQMVERTLKRSAAVLVEAEVPFCLIGSMAAWVRGGPESSHDLDYGIRECDIVKAAKALEDAGFNIEVPPEQWLIKAWDGPVGDPSSTLVDLIYAPSGLPITDEVLARADVLDVLAMEMRVLDATSIARVKMLSLREQHLNLTSLIGTVRSIREQIDWAELREHTMDNPYAEGFLVMCERLGLCPAEGEEPEGAENELLSQMQQDLRRGGARSVAQDERRVLIEHIARQAQTPVVERVARGFEPPPIDPTPFGEPPTMR